MASQIPCPVCQAPLLIDVDILASGATLACSNLGCGARISVAAGSVEQLARAVRDHRDVVALRA